MWLFVLKIVGLAVLILIVVVLIFIVWDDWKFSKRWRCSICSNRKLKTFGDIHFSGSDEQGNDTGGWQVWRYCPKCGTYSRYNSRMPVAIVSWDDIPEHAQKDFHRPKITLASRSR